MLFSPNFELLWSLGAWNHPEAWTECIHWSLQIHQSAGYAEIEINALTNFKTLECFIFLQSNYPMCGKKSYSTKRVEHLQFSSEAIRKRQFILPCDFSFTLMFFSHYHTNRPFAANDHVVQNPPSWRANSFLFSHWDIKTKASQASLF